MNNNIKASGRRNYSSTCLHCRIAKEIDEFIKEQCERDGLPVEFLNEILMQVFIEMYSRINDVGQVSGLVDVIGKFATFIQRVQMSVVSGVQSGNDQSVKPH